MNKLEIKHPGKAVSTSTYSLGVLTHNWLFVSGQGSRNMATGEENHGTLKEETLLTLSLIRNILEAAGGTIDDIVKCIVHLGDIKEFDRYDADYRSFFTGIRPARTIVQSVLSDEIKVEIDTIARISPRQA